MDTTTAPTAKGIAFLATHPDLLEGAYNVDITERTIRIQGNWIDMADTVLALHDLGGTAHVNDKHTSDDGTRFTTVTGTVDGIPVQIVCVTPAPEAVTA